MKEELKQRTIAVRKAVRKDGLKLRKSKCQFNMKELVFLGHNISHRGVEADTQKIAPISDMPNSTNKKELQRFLGMVNYLGKFIPNLSNETSPLRQLLAKDVMWSFNQPQIDAVNRLKQLVTETPVLKFYNPNLDIKIFSDASRAGLGAVIEQKHDDDWHPVVFASRSLQSSERNNSQLENDTLYLHARNFLIIFMVKDLMYTMTICH